MTNINEATIEQVRKFAQVNLGLEISATSNKQTIIGKMRAAGFEGDDIEVVDEISPTAAPDAVDGVDPNNPPEGYGTIMIAATEEPGGDKPVFVSVNGVAIHVLRNTPTVLKNRYIEALFNAKQSRLVQNTDNIEGGLKSIGEFPTYPVSRIA